MPELPEVETIRRQLLDYCLHDPINNVQFSKVVGAVLQNCDAQTFRQAVVGQAIREITRKGKYLFFKLDELYVVVHLGMSGIFITDRANSNYPQHIHLAFEFASGKQLFFQDMRRFGKIWLEREKPRIATLGIDPISETLTPEMFREFLKKRDTNVKLFLMDQRYIAGVGNIYASEMLHLAGISPLRKTGSLTAAEIDKLYAALFEVLNGAIERFGTTYSAYRTVSGVSGENQHFLKVYQRDGEPCYQCGLPLRKIVLGSRSTFFCENCQK
jgi:formamidopyrimidine-DNA glycosylase